MVASRKFACGTRNENMHALATLDLTKTDAAYEMRELLLVEGFGYDLATEIIHDPESRRLVQLLAHRCLGPSL